MSWRTRIVVVSILAVAGVVAWAALARALAPAQNTAQTHFDALIVLGYPTDEDGNPSPTQLAYVTEAVHEYEQGVASHIIMTGGPAHNQFVEAQTMARSAEAQGIPASLILEDTQAMNTLENACNSVRIMRAHGWQSAEIISSRYHLPRTAMIFGELPIQWRVHAAPPLGPQPPGLATFHTLVETLKTVRYLVWARQMDRCAL